MYADGKLRNHTFFVPRKCAKRHLGGALPTRPSQDPPPYGKRGAAAPPLILPGGSAKPTEPSLSRHVRAAHVGQVQKSVRGNAQGRTKGELSSAASPSQYPEESRGNFLWRLSLGLQKPVSFHAERNGVLNYAFILFLYTLRGRRIWRRFR